MRDQAFKAMQVFMGKLEAAAAAMVSRVSFPRTLGIRADRAYLARFAARDGDERERGQWSFDDDPSECRSGGWEQSRRDRCGCRRSARRMGYFFPEQATPLERSAQSNVGHASSGAETARSPETDFRDFQRVERSLAGHLTQAELWGRIGQATKRIVWL